MYLLGYDIGSSSVKASLVNAESGKCVSSAFFPKTEAEIIAVKPGWAEQNPENWWENLKLATQAVLADARVDAADIKAIGISYQMHGLVCVDKDQRCCVLQSSGAIPEPFLTDKKHLKRWERSYASRICSTLRVTSPRPNLPG